MGQKSLISLATCFLGMRVTKVAFKLFSNWPLAKKWWNTAIRSGLTIPQQAWKKAIGNEIRPEFVHHSCSRALGHGYLRFAQFLTLNTRFALHLMCLFAQNHCGFDFYQITGIMVFNFLNSNLCALFLKDWIMITLFCTCMFHWWIWSSRFFVSDWISIIFIVGWNFLITHFVLYNFCVL